MNENVVRFGENNALCGIVTLPEHINPETPAVLILNSGLMHRVGACRVSVTLARKFVELGFVALRFDFSGMGDSVNRPSELGADERIIEEAQLAMDFLAKKYDVSSFILYGLCSGAQNSFKTALKDDRIVGLIGIDNFGFHTKQYYIEHYFSKLKSVSGIFSLAKKAPAKLMRIFGVNKSGGPDQPPIWVYPSRDFIEKGYGELARKGLQFLYFYTGAWSHEYNYKNQIFDMYPSVDFGEQMEVHFKPEMSHILMEQDSQKYVLDNSLTWLRNHFVKS